MATFKKLIGLSLLITFPCQAASWYGQDQKGWLWYKAPLKEKKVFKKEPVKKDGQKPLTYQEKLQKVRQNFDEIKAKAILEPTLQNMTDFIKAQEAILSKASYFQEMGMMATLLNASSYRESDQPFPAHREIYKQESDKQLDQEIGRLTKQFGIFFLFKKDCPYCHQFAPIVRKFLNTYPFEFKAISKDGQTLPEFPDAVPDNGTIPKINPEGIYPTLFLVNPQTNEIIPLSRGLVNFDELKENLRTIVQFLKRGSGR